MARFSTIKNVLAPLLDPNNPGKKFLDSLGISPIPGYQYSLGAIPTQSGGELTGEILLAPIAKKGNFFTGLGSDLLKFASNLSLNPATIASNIATQALKSSLKTDLNIKTIKAGRVPMGFFDDVFGSHDSPGDSFNAGLGGSGGGFDWNNLLNIGGNIAGQLIGGGRSSTQNVPMQLSAGFGVPAVIGAGGVMVGRTIASAVSARLAALGLNRATAWTLLKQGGPAALITLGLSAADVAHVARSRGGYRRMNMCNGRALRRASRRLEGFHKFYKRTCGLPVRRTKYKSCK